MPENFKDILSHLSTEVDQETLLLYLQGKLSEEKKHDIEKRLMENDFANEAMEGLQAFKDKQQLNFTVEMLNRDLKKKLQKKKRRREKMRFKDQPWLYVALLIILLLIIISYFVIHKMLMK
jgi:hypothetical protein